MQEEFVDTPDALRALCTKLHDSEWIALDTEFIREKTYYPRLCLIQVCNGEIAACVDPLRLNDLQPLLKILYDDRIVKVLHAARQDLEIFLNDYQRLPMPVFDTQPAAALLGHGDQIGYANLVNLVLDVELPKDQSRTDWSQRPLNAQQTRYALDDVVYLGQLYSQMHSQLSERGRLQWLSADFAMLADPDTYYPQPETMWQRVKGRQRLRGRQLAVLQTLASWRETQARARNLPRKWILKDEVLIELSRRIPRDLSGLAQVRGIEPAQLRRDGKVLLESIAQAADSVQAQWPQDKARGKPLSIQQEAMVDLLSAALRLLGEQHQLSPLAIASHKELEHFVRGDADCPLLEGWRYALAGSTLQALLRGERQLKVQDGHLAMIADPH